MKVRNGALRRLMIVGLFLGLSVGACSSSSEQQQEAVESQGSQGSSQEGATDQASNSSGENQAEGGEVSAGNGANAADNGANASELGNNASDPGAGAGMEPSGGGNGAPEDGLTGLINDMNSSIGQSTNALAAAPSESGSGEMDSAQPAEPTADTMAPVADEGSLTATPATADSASPAPTQPIAQASSAELPEVGAKLAYIIEKGDTLGKISQKIFGTQTLWRQLAKGSGIADPNKIYPGEVIYYQLTQDSLAFASVYEAAPKSTVTVAAGDTLAKISKKIYGTTENWRSIWRQNDQINDPEALTAGTLIYYTNQNNLVSQVKSLRLKLEAEKLNSESSTTMEQSASNKKVFKTIDSIKTSDGVVFLGKTIFNGEIKG